MKPIEKTATISTKYLYCCSPLSRHINKDNDDHRSDSLLRDKTYRYQLAMVTTSSNGYHHKEGNDENIPKLCQFWINLQRRLPSMHFLGLDVSLTIASAIFLGLLRYLSEFIMVNAFGWPRNSYDTKAAASSVSSIFHSLNLVPTLYVLLVRTVKPYYNPSASIAEETAGQWWNDSVKAMLQFCTGYMLYDAVLTIGWLKSTMQEGGISSEDLLFLGHHLATTLYMSSARWAKAGHQSAMMCMLVGEITNPLHNSYYIALAAQKLDCCNGPFSQSAFAVIEFSFGLLYVIFRAIIGPAAIAHATFNLLTTGLFKVKELPAWLIIVWVSLMWAVLLGSVPWVAECWGFVLKPLPAEIATVLTSIFGGVVLGGKEEL